MTHPQRRLGAPLGRRLQPLPSGGPFLGMNQPEELASGQPLRRRSQGGGESGVAVDHDARGVEEQHRAGHPVSERAHGRESEGVRHRKRRGRTVRRHDGG